MNECAVVRLDNDADVQLETIVRSNESPVRPERLNLTFEPWPLDRAANDGNTSLVPQLLGPTGIGAVT